MENQKNQYNGIFNRFEDLIEAVSKLPSTIKYINVPSSYGIFGNNQETLQYSEDLADRVREIIEKGVHQDKYYSEQKEKNAEIVIDEYRLRAYCGDWNPDTDAYYIQCYNKARREFGESMSNGDFGPLD